MRNIYVLLGMVMLLSATAWGEALQAMTDDGRTVILYEDGTWRYRDPAKDRRAVVLHPDGTWSYQARPQTAQPGVASYTKPVSVTTLVKGEAVPYGIWVDERTWGRYEKKPNDVLEFLFTHTSGEVWGAVIAEETRLTEDFVKDFVLASAKKHMSGAKVISQDKRIINGNQILFLSIEGEYQSSPFMYLNYYYIGDIGTVQIYTWTLKSNLEKYQKDMFAFLNGFEVYTRMNQ